MLQPEQESPLPSSERKINSAFMQNFQDWKTKKAAQSEEVVSQDKEPKHANAKIIDFETVRQKRMPAVEVANPEVAAFEAEAELKNQADQIQIEIADLQQENEELVIPGTTITIEADLFTDVAQEEQMHVAWEKYENILTNPATAVGGVLSGLASCGNGLLCLLHPHHLSGIANAGSGLGSLGGGLNLPGFSVDGKGNFSLSGNLQKSLGISKKEFLAGKHSSQDIYDRLSIVIGESIGLIFGFGLVKGVIDCLFNAFLPSTSIPAEIPQAA